jgi:hypothetical protein
MPALMAFQELDGFLRADFPQMFRGTERADGRTCRTCEAFNERMLRPAARSPG